MARPPGDPLGTTSEIRTEEVIEHFVPISRLPGQFMSDSGDEGPWSVVHRKHRREQKSSPRARKNRSSKRKKSKISGHEGRASSESESLANEQCTLDKELFTAMHDTKRSLTEEDHLRILCHFNSELNAVEEHSDTKATLNEGAKQDKGKGVDPRNWGNVRLTADERDADLQRIALESILERRKHAHVNGDSDVERREHHRILRNKLCFKKYPYGLPEEKRIVAEKAKYLRPENIRNPIVNVIKKALTSKGHKPRKSETRIIEPVQQIAPTSYLGKALG